MTRKPGSLPVCPLGHVGCCRTHKAILSDDGEAGLCASLPAPEDEACLILKLVGMNGDTVKTIRELIAVPPEVETDSRAVRLCDPIWLKWVRDRVERVGS